MCFTSIYTYYIPTTWLAFLTTFVLSFVDTSTRRPVFAHPAGFLETSLLALGSFSATLVATFCLCAYLLIGRCRRSTDRSLRKSHRVFFLDLCFFYCFYFPIVSAFQALRCVCMPRRSLVGLVYLFFFCFVCLPSCWRCLVESCGVDD